MMTDEREHELKRSAYTGEKTKHSALPCEVGDHLFITLRLANLPRINEVEAKRFETNRVGIVWLVVDPIHCRGRTFRIYLSDWGRYVFRTRKEAESALK